MIRTPLMFLRAAYAKMAVVPSGSHTDRRKYNDSMAAPQVTRGDHSQVEITGGASGGRGCVLRTENVTFCINDCRWRDAFYMTKVGERKKLVAG